jgi:quercetin dioxygenase-like cupin family protein
MNVVNLRGLEADPVVGREQGAVRIFVWCITERAGDVLGPHWHDGEELFRVLSGRLRFQVGDDVREVGAGAIVVIPPKVIHSHSVLEDSELEVIGEIGSGVYVRMTGADGEQLEQELFVRDVPWSRLPADDNYYITREEQLERFRLASAGDAVFP